MASTLMWVVALLMQQTGVPFDVASIRPRPEQPERGIETVTQIGPHQIRLAYVSLADCISLAYRVSLDRIVGPEWLGTTRFDVAATVPSGATRQQVPEMLQALLAQRFRLRIHRETRELPGYALENRSAKLEPVAPEPEDANQPFTSTLNGSGAGIFVKSTGGASYALEKNRLEFRGATMTILVDALSLFAGRPVVDATNLTGAFNIVLDVPDARLNGELALKRLWLFLLVSVIDGPAIIVGSIIGAQVSRYFSEGESGQPGLFIGAIVGGLAGVAVAASAAVRLGLIPAHVRRRTMAGGMIGFALACLSARIVEFDSPIGPALSGVFVPLGAVIGSRVRGSTP